MFKVYDNTIFYVVCPANKKTGGTELAHQLVAELKKNNVNAYITYYYWEKFKQPINDAFIEYVGEFKKLEEIQDTNTNILIVPEINWYELDKFTKIQKGIWWMSVDNYVKNDGFLGACKVRGIYSAIKSLLKGNIKLFKRGFDKNVEHLYQSEYAHQFLIKNGIHNCMKLSDYVNDSYLDVSITAKNDVVLYNPKKGVKFTRKIIAESRDLKWVPIKNMTTDQVKDILSKSKIYVDFGNHPGKDRFPREAAISGCCVIVGKRGSAVYYEDIPIKDDFKFEVKRKNITNIISKIHECIDNYDKINRSFESYRNMIRNEHNIFEQDVKKIIRSEE